MPRPLAGQLALDKINAAYCTAGLMAIACLDMAVPVALAPAALLCVCYFSRVSHPQRFDGSCALAIVFFGVRAAVPWKDPFVVAGWTFLGVPADARQIQSAWEGLLCVALCLAWTLDPGSLLQRGQFVEAG